MKKHLVFWTILSAAILFLTSAANAQDYSNIRIVRLSFAKGIVQYQRPSQEWLDTASVAGSLFFRR